MDPEGSKNAESQTEDFRGASAMEGIAIWTSGEPQIYAAVGIPLGGKIDDKESSIDSAELPELIPANIYADKASDADEKVPLTTAVVVSNKDVSLDEEWLMSSLYKYSLIFGLLVGCFIQSSSLGANYILMIVFGRDFNEMSNHHRYVVVFSLGWSFLTSLMGIVILLILRSLVSLAANGLNKNNIAAGRPTVFLKRQMSLVAFLEFPFAFGALAGVCSSWAATDFVLGLTSHAYHSLLTLAFAYVGKMIFEACSNKASLMEDDDEEEENEWSVKQKLLPNDSVQASETDVEKINNEFKTKGLAAGLLVGFFIQLSSLGASFLIDALVNSKVSGVTVALSKESLLAFSLGWSFVFGTMGVTILLLSRYLIGIVCDHIISQSQGSDRDTEEEEDMADRWSVSLEFFFAVGCLVGVNVAWLITDVGLGLNAHVWRSLITLAAAAVWCIVLAHCFGFRKALYSPKPSRGKKVTKATQTTANGMLIV